MKKYVWVVTKGSYSDKEIVGVFSTEEKANDFYQLHKVFDDDMNEPESYELDSQIIITSMCAIKTNNCYNWIFEEWVSGNSESISEDKDRFYYAVKINFNSDINIMKKSADDRVAFLKAQKEEIA